jgi:hypothetical protein
VGGVPGRGQGRAGGQLGGVEGGREPLGVDPQVDLERGVGPLQADVVGDQLQGVGPVDPDAERLLAQPADAVVERPVASRVREGGQPEVVGPQGGQDPHHHHPAVVPGGGPADDGQGRMNWHQVGALPVPDGQRLVGIMVVGGRDPVPSPPPV